MWYAHNGAPHKHYNECVTSNVVAAVQENRNEVLKIYARHAAGHTPAAVRALRTEKYTTWVQILFQLVIPFGVLLVCLIQAPVVCLLVVAALLYVRLT